VRVVEGRRDRQTMSYSVGAEDSRGHGNPVGLNGGWPSAVSHNIAWQDKESYIGNTKHTRGRFGSLSSAGAIGAVVEGAALPFTVPLVPVEEPFPALGATRFPFETPEPAVGPRTALSFWLVVLEVSDLESSMFRGRAGGMVAAPHKILSRNASKLRQSNHWVVRECSRLRQGCRSEERAGSWELGLVALADVGRDTRNAAQRGLKCSGEAQIPDDIIPS